MKPETENNPKKELEQLISDSQKDDPEIEKILDKQNHQHKDHYHGIHHFDKQGHHDDISETEFSLKQLFKLNKRMATFQIAATGIILALSIGLSAIDMLMEHISVNIGGVEISMRIFDLTIIIIGLPIAGFYGSLLVGMVEPWFHFLIDSDHLPLQVFFDSLGYMLVVVLFFLIYFAAFKNSPIHKEPDKKKRIAKNVLPGVVIVPILSIIFTIIFMGTALISGVISDKEIGVVITLIFVALGMQVLRFILMYCLFVLIENKLKPVVHLYQ